MTTEEENREDANVLLNTAIAYARRMLRKYGEFGPFGYKISSDGDVTVEAVVQKEMPPDAAMLLDLLRQQFIERAQRGSIVAAAMVSNVTMGKASDEGYTDAIMVDVEHQGGYCMKAFVPYRISGGQLRGVLPRVVRFGAMRAQKGEAQVFAR
jgi:hypothetical protein